MAADFIKQSPFLHKEHECGVCVVGGGMAGICAAISAARKGVQTILVQDRPVLGGNSSSEIGVRVLGADRGGEIPHMRETGILEELRLNNLLHNPQAELPVWDLVLFDLCMRENNLELLLNCSIVHADCEEGKIQSVTGWQLSTQTWHTVKADIFADCSGDSILAPLSGADYMRGREASSEYSESIAPEEADECTMGHTCGYLAREYDGKMKFTPYDWARKFHDCNDFPWGSANHDTTGSPWWAETGGQMDTIHDSEKIRDELLKINLGLWDHIKNGPCVYTEKYSNFALSRVNFVVGRRESRRYMGHHVLTQNDIESGGHFEDNVAYGGWTMDDHHPAGFESFKRYDAPPTIHHPAPSPYGIPYRSLISKNVSNLMFAGRNISCTHAAMSSTRVMGTCASLGQAVGTAAAMAVSKKKQPIELLDNIDELQQALLEDDAYIPYLPRKISAISQTATITSAQGEASVLCDGINRQVGEDTHCIMMRAEDTVTFDFTEPAFVHKMDLVLDSAMETCIALRSTNEQSPTPKVLVKRFLIEAKISGKWETCYCEESNYQRFRSVVLNLENVSALRYTLLETYGAEETRLYAIYVD